MPFDRPTLTELRDGAIADIAASQIYDATTREVVNPVLLQYDPLSIMARVMAGLAYEEFGYLDWISLQATPFTATDEAALAWGALVGITPKPAAPARGTASFPGLPGTDIPGGTQLTRADGVLYITTADMAVPASGVAVVPFAAAVPGAAGTIAAGAALNTASPVVGVNAGTVAASAAPGSDIETNDSFRARYLARFASPPNGGSASDYLQWALAVPGVTRAWVSGSAMGPGTVGIFVMLDGSEAPGGGFPVGSDGVSPLDNNGRPRDSLIATGDQATVADALIPLQPVTALVYVSAPEPAPIAFIIDNLGTANTATIHAAITAALQSMFLALGDPRGVPIYPSAWTGAIASVPGVKQFTVNAPLGPVILPPGQLPIAGLLVTNS